MSDEIPEETPEEAPKDFDVQAEDMDLLYQEGVGLVSFQSFCDIFSRELTFAEFEYLLARYPFLDIAESSDEPLDADVLEKHTTPNGWIVHDYGSRIITGPGRLSFGRFSTSNDDDDEEGGAGSLWWQGIETVEAIFGLISARWDSLTINGGSYALQRCSWMMGLDNGLSVEGYAPTEEDKMRRDRVIFLREGEPHELIHDGLHFNR